MEGSVKMRLKENIPNALSLFRIFCIPFFFYFLLIRSCWVVLGILVLGSLSDFFDGYLARKFHVESKVGALLDPLADKLFANSVLWGLALIALNHPGFDDVKSVYIFLAMTLTVRDIILLIGSYVVVVKKFSIDLKPMYLSKVNTALVFLFAITSIPVMFGTNGRDCCVQFASYAIEPLGLTCVILTIVTFIIYTTRFAINLGKVRNDKKDNKCFQY